MAQDPDERQKGAPGFRRTFKDSIFTNLFSDPRYTFELYQALHPEDREATIDDVQLVTLQNVMTNGQYNDLGFTVGDRLLVLVEAQSTWSPNIVLRALMYTMETVKRYISEHNLSLYRTKGVEIPRPELYVIYTGTRRQVPAKLSLTQELFGGAASDVEATVTVLRGDSPDIVGQYVEMAGMFDAARSELGSTEEAVRSAIDECIERGVLVEYLTRHRQEVMSIMYTLFDEEEVLRIHMADCEREASERGMARGMAQGMAQGMEKGMAQGMEKGMAQGKVQGLVDGIVTTCKKLGATVADAAGMLSEQLGISGDAALAEVQKVW